MPVSPRKPNPGALLDAVADYDYAAVRRLIDQGANLEERDMDGNTPLNRAARYGYMDIIRCLLEKGADVDTRNSLGNTPLITLVSSYGESRDSIIRMLLEKGANPDIKNNAGKTALNIAAEKNRISVTNMLRDASLKRKRAAEEFARAAEKKRHAELEARQDALRKKAPKLNLKPKQPPQNPPKAA